MTRTLGVPESFCAGVAIEARNRAGQTAAELARTLGSPSSPTPSRTARSTPGLRWLRDARRRGTWGIYLSYYSKAWGLGFNPIDVDCPVLTGGDYDGFGYDIKPEIALDEWRRNMAEETPVRPLVAWFMPLLEKLQRGEDFGLDELERAAPARCRLQKPP